jgi:tRNA C32,U32 (ribose-2'-O)-methylase TrmJ
MKRMSTGSTSREYVLFQASTLLQQSALSKFVGTVFGREEHGCCLAICNEELRLCTTCNAIECSNIYIITLHQLFHAYV